ncbi:hypothetical protein EZI54_05895 [Marinobacter halodurans]|uniref:RiboL-PSP-HEPN domain-containing protein n=1 Tax=Marinobacter halodurans TaxID=2528979 RepID=A0ABY1ZSB8_9GAMM|nr:hypothetical protein [Marinobacter halodurans]TBW57980.1 hypothetical protein EZI54_05895 [Marinobacter halodurans]
MKQIFEFEHTVDGLYGVYLDSLAGFRHLHAEGERKKANLAKLLCGDSASDTELAGAGAECVYSYAKGEPGEPDFVEIHTCTYDEYISRTAERGMNQWFAGNMLAVNIYAFWENFHRQRIASLLGKEKSDIRAPIMGDLRRYRQSILHHNGKALKGIRKCEVLKWYSEGDAIFLDNEKVHEIILQIKKFIQELKTEWRK